MCRSKIFMNQHHTQWESQKSFRFEEAEPLPAPPSKEQNKVILCMKRLPNNTKKEPCTYLPQQLPFQLPHLNTTSPLGTDRLCQETHLISCHSFSEHCPSTISKCYCPSHGSIYSHGWLSYPWMSKREQLPLHFQPV